MFAPLNIFGSIGGLPLHPLVVHAAVVLLPLSSLGLLAVIFVRRWRKPYAWLGVAGILVGSTAAGVSVLSGRELAAQIGRPDRHAQLGNLLAITAAVLSVAAIAWWILQRRGNPDSDPPATRVFGWLTAALIAATLTLTVLVGHSGAQAAWGERIGEPAATGTPQTSEPASTPSGTASSGVPSSSADESASTRRYSLDEVAQHASAESCWAAIDGNVYDLTSWIDQHPGGSQRIVDLCGTDASQAFSAQHSRNQEANGQLAELWIGTLE